MSDKRNWRRSGRRNRHHVLPKSRGGVMQSDNIIYLDEARHQAFHFLFGLRTFEEAALVLIKTEQYLKRRR